jgi:hypothetical protein
MRKLHAGVILLREWGGTRHQVTVLANGVFKWKATIFSVYLCNLLRQNRVSSDYFFDEFEALDGTAGLCNPRSASGSSMLRNSA